MRTHFSTTIKRVFCGTALIEYSSEEDAQKILEQSLIFDGAELEYLVKDFDEERKKHGQVVDNTQSGPGCKSSDEADFPKGLAVAFTLKRKQFRLKEISSHNSVKLEADTSKTDGGECEEIVCQGSNKVAEVDEKVDEVIEDDAKQKINSKSGCETDEKEAKDDKKSSQVGDNKDEVEVAIKGKSGYIGFEIPEASQKARAVALLSEQGGLIVKNFIACLEPVTAFRH